jgi:hypothetical protein
MVRNAMTTRSATTPSTIIFASMMSTRFCSLHAAPYSLQSHMARAGSGTNLQSRKRTITASPAQPTPYNRGVYQHLSRDVIGETPFFTTYAKAQPPVLWVSIWVRHFWSEGLGRLWHTQRIHKRLRKFTHRSTISKPNAM